MPDLLATTDLFKLFADPSRVRLASVLADEELTVAELTEVTGLAQSRVSTHLARLRDAGLLRARRAGPSAFYSLDDEAMPPDARRVWDALRGTLDDEVLREDTARVAALVRGRGSSWAEGVAGQMERHYSPGRTWEAAAWALAGLGRLGEVLDVASGDGALAELVAPRARRVWCVDLSERVVQACSRRLGHLTQVRAAVADMHALPFGAASFDHVMLVNSLSYAADPARAVREAARVLRPGGEVVAVALRRHRHRAVAARYNHVQTGFQPGELRALFEVAGLEVTLCEPTSRERRAPHFEVLTLYARRPERAAAPARRDRPGPVRRPRRAPTRRSS